MPDADFAPLRPRRHGAAEAPDEVQEAQPSGEVVPAPIALPQPADGPKTASPPANVAPIPQHSEDASAQGVWNLESPPGASCERGDEAERAAELRDEAIRFASIATARALRTALAHDAAALTRYVDDALQACGRVTSARVRLHPADAALYRPRRGVEIIADAAAQRGDVAVEGDTGIVSATIEERAGLLVRAASHA